MWRKRRERRRASEPEPIFQDLRAQFLTLDPSAAGIAPSTEHPRVWGALMEMGMEGGVASLVALADGATSLYTSTGGGVIGGGEHEPVARAAKRFLTVLEEHADQLEPEAGSDLPGDGEVYLRALTYDGRLAARAAEDDLGQGRHALSPVFYAGHDVITVLREVAPE